MISLRLNSELEILLDRAARKENKTRTDIVRDSIQLYLSRENSAKTPYELGEKYFGKFSSNKKDLSENRKKYLVEYLGKKQHDR